MAQLLTVRFEGPFFRSNPGKTLRGNVRDMMEALAVEAEDEVKTEVGAHAGQMPRYTGYSRNAIVGRVKSVAGKPWMASMVVSSSTVGKDAAESKRTLAAASIIEGRWHIFRRTASAIRRSRAVLRADLVKGLN